MTPLTSTTKELQQKSKCAARQTASRNEIAHTSEEWEALREVIRQLYIEENRTLSTLSHILEKQHDFIATPKQYKIRFKQWGFWKNLSTRNASNLLQLKESRESLGKTSTFLRSGHKLDINRIEKTIRRSRIRALSESARDKHGGAEASPSCPASSLPAGLECRTPSPDLRPIELGQLSTEDCFGFGLTKPWMAQGGHFENHTFINDSSTYATTVGTTATEDLFVQGLVPQGLLLPSSDQLTVCSAGARVRNSHQEKLERCYHVSQKKLALSSRGDAQRSLDAAELRSFRSKNALLAILEPAIGDQHRMFELFLHNFAATFISDSQLSKFIRLHIAPHIQHDWDLEAQTKESIHAALCSIGLSDATRGMLDAITASDSRTEAAGDATTTWDDANLGDYIDPSALSPSTELSAPESEMPLTPLDDIPCGSSDPRLLGELDAVATAYHEGDESLARARLRSVTARGAVVTVKGRMLTRLAWYCLSHVSGRLGRAEEAESCLVQAVRGSTYFRDDDGEEWEDVCHLFG